MVRALGTRRRPSQIPTVLPASTSPDYSHELANLAAHIIYRSPLPSQDDLPIYIVNAAAFPDAKKTDYDTLLPYVLARLPGEDELIGGLSYEVIFFAGAGGQGATSSKKSLPGWRWLLQTYHLLTRAMRKRLSKLYIVHEKTWMRMLIETFSSVISPKGRKKIEHISTLGQLALLIPIQDLQLPLSALVCDRQYCPSIDVPYMLGHRSFGVAQPLPIADNGAIRLPRVLRESTSFVMIESMLKTEGLFRINARAVTVDVLKEAFSRGQKFIAWKEGDSMTASIHRREGHGDVMIDDLARTEGYDIHTATALIKQWYKDLLQPIFPQTSYSSLKRVVTSHDTSIPDSTLIGMLANSNDWSPLSPTAKKIMFMHLLPLLSAVAQYQVWNQMDPHNLAICFAPTLVHGPDPVEDVQMAKIAQNVLEHMVRRWEPVLASTYGFDQVKFADSLRSPENTDDREDPLEIPRGHCKPDEDQSHGSITLLHADESTEHEERPPLPPRPFRSVSPDDSNEPARTVRRKPAPAMATLPRYSTAIREAPPFIQQIPNFDTGDADDDFEAVDPSDLPPYESASSARSAPDPSSRLQPIPRKPLHNLEDQ